MTSIFYWTGALVWGIIAVVLMWLIFESLRSVVTCISFYRWSLAIAKAQNKPSPFWKFIPDLGTRWWAMLGHRNGSTTWSNDNTGGQWRGIGDWHAGRALPLTPITQNSESAPTSKEDA